MGTVMRLAAYALQNRFAKKQPNFQRNVKKCLEVVSEPQNAEYIGKCFTPSLILETQKRRDSLLRVNFCDFLWSVIIFSCLNLCLLSVMKSSSKVLCNAQDFLKGTFMS